MNVPHRIHAVRRAVKKAFLRMILPAAAFLCAASVSSTEVLAAADPEIVTTNGIEGWPGADDIPAETGCLMDADTGVILFDKGMDHQMYPASITKVMTTLVALKYGNLDDIVTVTEESAAYVYEDSSNLYIAVGEQFRLEDLLYGTMLKSANDMATAVAVHISGSAEAFAELMNEEAEKLGCTGTHFHNACGMPDPEHWTTAHDMVLMGREALRYDKFREIVGTLEYSIPPTNLNGETRIFANHNPLQTEDDFYYEGIIGGKTGYTDAAGNTLTNYCERDGMTLIVTTMKSEGIGNAITANRALLNYGYGNFHHEEAKEASYAEAGGLLTLPNGTTASDCEITEEVIPDDEHGDLVVRTYSVGGQKAGSVTLTAKAIEENEKPEEPEVTPKPEQITATPEPEPEITEAAGEPEAAGGGDGAQKKESSGLSRILILLILLGLAGLAAVELFLSIRRAKTRKHKRRRGKKA